MKRFVFLALLATLAMPAIARAQAGSAPLIPSNWSLEDATTKKPVKARAKANNATIQARRAARERKARLYGGATVRSGRGNNKGPRKGAQVGVAVPF